MNTGIAQTRMVSGVGVYHTNEPGKPNATPYLTIGVDGVRQLVDTPQEVQKTQAQWLIPSTLPSRNFKKQEQDGQFVMLWADLDTNPPDQNILADIIETLTGGADFEIYSSSSATTENMKCRVLIFLKKSLPFADWASAQSALNDKLEALGIIPDRATERSAQLCYLPNRGAFYESIHDRNGQFFEPLQFWATEIAVKHEQIAAATLAIEVAKQAAAARRATLNMSETPDLIGMFNLVYTVEELLKSYGYDQSGYSFRHPQSESGSYSATVKDGRVNTLSTNDPLYTGGQGAHDAFGVFCTLFHGGNTNAAIKDAGDRLLSIDGVPYNKAKQIEWAKNKTIDTVAVFGHSAPTPSFNLADYSLNGSSTEMENKMIADKFILGKLAIMGQATVIYSPPNSGKTLLTLWLLISAIRAEHINANDVFYINADDNSKGLLTKLKLAERYGFYMLAPGHGATPYKSSDLMLHMRTMVAEGSASGKVILLDTLKKFTDLMDKKVASEFMRAAREFVSNGGTLIFLAHTNKNRNADGKVIFGGTSDIVDDVDCAYTLDVISTSGDTKSVLFENIKNRGDVTAEAGYTYSTLSSQTYEELLNSVKPLDEQCAEQSKSERGINEQLKKDAVAIASITELIERGITAKTELVATANKECGVSKKKLIEILNTHSGDAFWLGHRWKEIPGDKHTKNYSLLLSTFPLLPSCKT